MQEAKKADPFESEAAVERFKSFYRDLIHAEWAELDAIYAEHVSFKDPVHSINGRDALHRYLQSLCRGLSSCRFVYLDQVVTPGKAYIKWDMHFQHPNVQANAALTLRGTSQILFSDDRIHYHEDFYDMGALLYERLPLLGAVIRWLRRRLAEK